jgi:gliding motility-associated-like protein
VNINYNAVVYVPNTFIPDNNGKNDVFQVYGGNIKEMECLIFNRWGELITTLSSTTDFWDGTYKGLPCPDGTYTWKLIYKDFLNDKYQLNGHVNLLR